MKKLIALCLAFSLHAFAHDEGHGPKLTDAPKQGGVVTSVVLAKDASKGAKAELIYKGELARSSDGTVRVYFYDKNMSALDLASFAAKAKAELITVKKGKVSVQNFELEKSGDHFVAKLPKPSRRPFNVDVRVTAGAQELLAAFDNLD